MSNSAVDPLRLFFAIEVSNEIREAWKTLRGKLRMFPWAHHLRWVRPENLHITLRFVGHCPLQKQFELVEHVNALIKTIPPFNLQLGPLRLFPLVNKPRALIASIQPQAELFKLAQAVEQGVVATGFEKETRSYLPHLTLAKLRTPHELKLQEDLVLSPQASVLVENIALLHSEQDGNSQRVYIPLQRLSLNNIKHPRVAVGAIVIKNKKILLVKRKHPPQAERWAIPGGKVLLGETLQQAVEREIREETAIIVQAQEPIYVFDLIDRDHENNLRFHYVIIDLKAKYISGEATARDDASQAAWFSEEELKNLALSETTRKFLTEKAVF